MFYSSTALQRYLLETEANNMLSRNPNQDNHRTRSLQTRNTPSSSEFSGPPLGRGPGWSSGPICLVLKMCRNHVES